MGDRKIKYEALLTLIPLCARCGKATLNIFESIKSGGWDVKYELRQCVNQGCEFHCTCWV